MNQITLFGRIGRDPESRTVGKSEVCKTSLATSQKWREESGQMKERTEWHTIEAWGGTAKALARVAKGETLLVSGELVYNEWTDKEGAKRRDAIVKVRELTYTNNAGGNGGDKASGGDRPKSDRGERRQQAPAPPMTGNGGGFADDDIPF
jgi:single-strand DNA-binding protein